MSYFTTRLSLNLLVKEFLKFVNIWRSYMQNGDCFMRPIRIALLSQRCWSRQISWITCVLRTETVTNHCYVNRQTNVSLLSTKYQTAVDQFWLTDWQTDAISDWPTADHVRHFAATVFLCCGSCVQWVIGFFYMADVNYFLSLNYIVLISLDIYLRTVFEWLNLA